MDVDADTPSPKRQRTSRHNSSAPSSRQSSPPHLDTSQSPRASPDTASHRLPLRHVTSSGIRGGSGTRYHTSVSRDGSPYQDESDEDNRRAYWRDKIARQSSRKQATTT